MADTSRDRQAFELAVHYLLSLEIAGLEPALLERYMTLPALTPRPDSAAGLTCRLLESAASGGMRAGVIAGAIGGVDQLGKVLADFDPAWVIARYGQDWEALLEEIVAVLAPRGKIRRAPRSTWPLFCRTILDAARFMGQFADADDFYGWADRLYADPRGRLGLPLLMEAEIFGIGFPLVCDFLKELGYTAFAKPDVHLSEIFTALGLCPEKASPYEMHRAISRVADSCGRTAYAVDKIFWLIGSGDFYLNPELGNQGKIGRQKGAFIEHARERMG